MRLFSIIAAKIHSFATVFIGLLLLLCFAILLFNIFPLTGNFQTLFSEQWNPENRQFGLLSMVSASLFCAIFANIIVFPIGLICALCIRFLIPSKWQPRILLPLELLAAVPSLVFGMIGLAYVGPELFGVFQNSFLDIALRTSFGVNVNTDATLVVGGFVLAFLMLPYAVVFCFEATKCITNEEILAADSLGMRRSFFIVNIAILKSRIGFLAAFLQSFSRTLGEAVALSLVIGRADRLFWASNSMNSEQSTNILTGILDLGFSPGQTLATKLAGPELFISWNDPVYKAAMLSLVLCLFILTSGVYLVSHFLQRKLKFAQNLSS